MRACHLTSGSCVPTGDWSKWMGLATGTITFSQVLWTSRGIWQGQLWSGKWIAVQKSICCDNFGRRVGLSRKIYQLTFWLTASFGLLIARWLGWGPGWNRKSRACMWRMGSTGATLMPLCDDWRKSPLSSSAALQNLFCRKGVKVPTLSHRTRQGWGTPYAAFLWEPAFDFLFLLE